MQFLIVLTMLPVAMVNSRREVARGQTAGGTVLGCGEYHLAYSQEYIINSDVAQESASSPCKWKFTAKFNEPTRVPEKEADIRIYCNVDMRSSSGCKDAYLIIYDGGRVKQRYCGKQPNVYLRSATGFLAVTTKTKKGRNGSGKFQCVVSSKLKYVESLEGEAPPPKEPPTSLPAPLSFFQVLAEYFTGEE